MNSGELLSWAGSGERAASLERMG